MLRDDVVRLDVPTELVERCTVPVEREDATEPVDRLAVLVERLEVATVLVERCAVLEEREEATEPVDLAVLAVLAERVDVAVVLADADWLAVRV